MPGLRYPSKTERKIVKILIEFNSMTAYQITKKFYNLSDSLIIVNKQSFIRKVLQELIKRGILIAVKSNPVFYEISKSMKGKKYEAIMYEVECPACKKKHWIMDGAQTKQCSCLTSDKKPRRFWLTKERYTGERKII